MYPIRRLTSCPQFFAERRRPRFVAQLVRVNRVVISRINEHPFNKQLFQGTLPPSTFGKYLRDDFYYLKRFSSVLLQLSHQARDVNAGLAHHLEFLAKDIVTGELQMQHAYSEYLGDLNHFIPSAAIVAYADFLTARTRNAPLCVALCSILPCFWIYKELGTLPIDSTELNANPYKRWIQTYSGDEFVAATSLLAHTVDLLSADQTPTRQQEMMATFRTAVQHELSFFEEVYPSLANDQITVAAKVNSL